MNSIPIALSLSKVFVLKTERIPEVDLHCHILPNWDDGPRSVEESLSLARKAADTGIKRILVTPHVGRAFGSRPEWPSQNIAAAIGLLQEQIAEAGIQIELVPGAELTLSPVDSVERVLSEPWLSFGAQRRYVLVESPFHFWPEWGDQLLFELSLQNITPIIAHPERLADAQKDVDFLRPLVSRGVLLQITARSLVSSQRQIKTCCRQLLEAGLVAVVASDAHAARHIWPREVETEIIAVVGEAAAQQILVENPRAVLDGEALAVPAPIVPPRKSGLAGLFQRSLRK